MKLKGNIDAVSYATVYSAGCDVLAAEQVTISPGGRALVSTGIYIEESAPDEAIWVTPKSGLAWKHGITVLNSPGLIDSDYPGEIKVILMNHGSKEFTVNIGDKVAQLVLIKLYQRFENILVKSEMRTGGFGSTGS